MVEPERPEELANDAFADESEAAKGPNRKPSQLRRFGWRIADAIGRGYDEDVEDELDTELGGGESDG